MTMEYVRALGEVRMVAEVAVGVRLILPASRRTCQGSGVQLGAGGLNH